jgi:hypothetical protein
MRILKLPLVAILIAAPLISICAQSVVITKRKVIYRRPKPQMKYKRTFVINYPKIKASTPAISAKIESQLNYFKLFEFTLREEMNDLQWLEEANYSVDHNANGILSVRMSISGSGAYPDGSTKHVVISAVTGERLRAETLFADRKDLANLADRKLQIEIAKAKKDIKADQHIGDIDVDELFDGKTFDVESLNDFSLNKNGVTFYYDYGFPHVIEAIKPLGEFHFSWAELRPFVRSGSLLATFVR